MNKWAQLVICSTGAAVALTACTPPHPRWGNHGETAIKAITALECPPNEGDLTRQAVAADGKSCDYTDPTGAKIKLQLVSLSGVDAKTALAPIADSLRAEMAPGATAPENKGGPAAGGSKRGRVDIDLPGIHIHANGDADAGDKAADGAGTSVSVGDDKTVVTEHKGGGGVVVDAGDEGAEIRVDEPGGGVRQMLILASDTPGPHGFKAAGYEARGPSSGPIVVASMLSKSEDDDDLRDDVRSLIRLNVGG